MLRCNGELPVGATQGGGLSGHGAGAGGVGGRGALSCCQPFGREKYTHINHLYSVRPAIFNNVVNNKKIRSNKMGYSAMARLPPSRAALRCA